MRQIWNIVLRECGMLRKNPVYLLATLILPVFVTIFFTTLMDDGQPQEMPVGVVDQDNSSTTRNLIRRLEMMQTTHITAHYPNVSEARHAMQRGEIYGFIHFPKGTTASLLSSRRPKIDFYYTSTSMLAGSLLYRDMKTVTTLGSAGVGQATMKAKGFTDSQIMAFLQPIKIDLHTVNNPTINYNLYLSTMLIPACLMLFITLLSAYSLGMELKNGTSKEVMKLANGNIIKVIIGKFLPQTIIYLSLVYGILFYMFYVLGFTHQGGAGWIIALGLLAVLAGQGFGIFIFGLIPSVRMSMSVCSLWGVLSFSMAGTAFPAFAMDAPLQAMAWLFPMRHYWLIYALNIFSGYPLADTWIHVGFLIVLAAMPLLVLARIKNVYENYCYTE